ncbi:MAG: hypothetical protein ABJ370_07390 [Paracoccaceae bacterium]
MKKLSRIAAVCISTVFPASVPASASLLVAGLAGLFRLRRRAG